MDPKKLPDHDMPNAEPARKMFSADEVEQPNLQETETSETGDLSMLRRKGVSDKLNLNQ